MGDVYIDIVGILQAAGCQVEVRDVNAGWRYNSRSSGGFNDDPFGVQWHHTASKASVDSDLGYMINGSPDNPVGNVLLDRDGIYHPVAGGAANTSGKGGPNSFSRGTCPKDSGNTVLFSIEIANNGVGEQYTQAQIDAAFKGSNALNAAFGNQPTDVVTHALGAGDGYTDRKIDPATANLAGAWVPAPVNSSGTWSQADLRAECQRRAGNTPGPIPGPVPGNGVIDMYVIAVIRDGWPGPVDLVVAADGTRWNRNGHTSSIDRLAGVPRIDGVGKDQLLGILLDRPGHGDHPFGPGDYRDDDLAAAW